MTNKIFILIIASLVIFTGCKAKKVSKDASNSDANIASSTEIPTDNLKSEELKMESKTRQFPGVLAESERLNKQAEIKLQNGGVVIIELFGDEAPKTVSNFIALAKDKFYDGLTFHRIEPDFVVQGGDPNGNGTGGPGYKFEDEPVTRDYNQGIVAMANAGPNTNGSQFFIILEDTPLPKQYTIFGQVISGFEFVQKIKVGDKMESVRIENIN